MKKILFLLSITFFILSCNQNDTTAKKSVKTYLKAHVLKDVKYVDNGFGKLYAVGTSDKIEKAFNINADEHSPEELVKEMKPMSTFLGFGLTFSLSSGSEAYDQVLKNAIFCDSIIEKNKFTPNQYIISHKFTLQKEDGSEVTKEMIFRLDSTMCNIKGIKEREF